MPWSWTHALAEIARAPLEPSTPTPASWQRVVQTRTGQRAPRRLTEGGDATYRQWDAGEGDTDDPVDRAIAVTRRAVFPAHGLDPWDPR